MPGQPVALTIGGQSYRVHSDADPTTLQRLAAIVDKRVATCNQSGRLSVPQALLYAALLLAEELEEERETRANLESNTRESLRDLLRRIDAALDTTDALRDESSSHSATTT